jgi:hypothetical protein
VLLVCTARCAKRKHEALQQKRRGRIWGRLMRASSRLLLLCFAFATRATFAQVAQIDARIVTKPDLDGKVAQVEVAPRFVTTVRLPEAVNSVVVGDPSKFQVEHSEREPRLIFVKAVSTKPAQTNLLISTISGRQISLLLVSRGEIAPSDRAQLDFLLRYEATRGFFVAPSDFPSALVGGTVPLIEGARSSTEVVRTANLPGDGIQRPSTNRDPPNPRSAVDIDGLDKLLEQQENAPLPVLYGEHVSEESVHGDRVRAGVSRVIDRGQQVVVLFSVVNPAKHAVLLMPPQVQLGGMVTAGTFIRHRKWSTAEQLPVMDFRLNKRRVGPGERADGVVLFERPPYKQSNETLLLQVAESGAVDRPALAPIGFGISTASEDRNGRGK